jgi:hypothetical protein
VIEVEVAGEPGPGAAQGARGFVGVAFRVQPDMQSYDAFYLRPTNGRAEDQERRNHAVQYISHPTLVVNDVKTGAGAKGAVALWLGPGTIAHFRNLRVEAEPATR